MQIDGDWPDAPRHTDIETIKGEIKKNISLSEWRWLFKISKIMEYIKSFLKRKVCRNDYTKKLDTANKSNKASWGLRKTKQNKIDPKLSKLAEGKIIKLFYLYAIKGNKLN